MWWKGLVPVSVLHPAMGQLPRLLRAKSLQPGWPHVFIQSHILDVVFRYLLMKQSLLEFHH